MDDVASSTPSLDLFNLVTATVTGERQNSMTNETILTKLKAPFHPSHVTWKPGSINKEQTKALALAYADLRAYQNRLDKVCGMDWSVTYTPWGDRIVCHVTIQGVTRSSSGEPDTQSERAEVAGTSAEAQAFKRACAMFGLGRYLYTLPSVWVEYDGQTKRFTEQAKAKLEGIIVQHYRRQMAENTPAEKEAVPSVELLAQFEQLGQELYGEQWTQVSRHNVERMTDGETSESASLAVEQIQKLVDGMKKLQGKRHTVTAQGAENGF